MHHTKNEVTNAIIKCLMDSGIRVEYARLVCQQWHAQRVPYTTGQWSLNAAEVCGLRTRPLADADPQ